MIAARTVKLNEIEKMKTDLNAAIKSFDDAMKVTTFERAKTAAAQSTLATLRSQHADEALLSGRLEVVKTNYDREFRCDDRDSPRERVINWVSTRQESRTYWIYGLPGIGKTSLAHSICATLHDKQWLAGAFFCRRDDEGLSDHKNILPSSSSHHQEPSEPSLITSPRTD